MADSTACASQPPDYCGNISIPRMDPEVQAGYDVLFWVIVLLVFLMMCLPLTYVVLNGDYWRQRCGEAMAPSEDVKDQRQNTRRAREVVVIGGKV